MAKVRKGLNAVEKHAPGRSGADLPPLPPQLPPAVVHAVLTLVTSAPESHVSRWVTPDGDVVVVARARGGDFRRGAQTARCGKVIHDASAGPAACTCLYQWYEEHK